jgi:hypothetical protein
MIGIKMDPLQLPSDTKIANKIVEGHVRNEQSKTDRGSIGGLLGSRNSIPANVAAIISLIASIVFIVSVTYWAGNPDYTRKDAAVALSGLITLTVGFLFGRASKD